MSILAPLLNNFLHQYIKEIDKKQANFDLTKNNITLQDFSFTPNLFTNFGIPLVIKSSKVGNAIINLQIITINKTAMLQLNNVDIYAVVDFTEVKEDFNFSIDKLIQSIEKDKKPTLLDKKKDWYGWFEKIIDNAKVEIKNVRLHIEFGGLDDTTNSITLYLESLEMKTVDTNSKSSLIEQKPKILIKKIDLTNFSVAIHNDVTSIKNFKQLNGMNYNFLKNGSFSFTLTNTNRRNTTFFNIFKAVFQPINFTLNENQYLALRHLFKEYLTSKLFQKFHISQKLKNENQADWSYFNYLSTKKRCPHTLTPDFALQFLKKRKSFYQNFSKKTSLLTPMKRIIKDSLEENGKDLTYSLLLYTSILIRFQKSDKKTIIDLLFSSQNSVDFQVEFPKISFDAENLFSFSTENIAFSYKQSNKDFNVDLTINDCLITDLYSKSNIIQKNEDQNCDFIHFSYNFKKQTKVIDICKFKFDIKSSFINRFSRFFFNVNKNNADNNYLNQCLMMLNPLFLQKFKLESKGFQFNYTINNDNKIDDDDDDEIVLHLFNCDVKKFVLQSNPENSMILNDNVESQLDIFSEFECGQIKVDESVISNELKVQCLKRRIVDNYDVSIFDAQINIDSKIIEMTKDLLSSISNNVQIDFKNVYSLNSILVNCSKLSFNINTGNEDLILSISKINVNPYVEFNDVLIQKSDKEKIILIPSLSFNEWPAITTESFKIKLNSFDFLKFSEEFNWMTNQIKKLSSCFLINLTNSNAKVDDDDDVVVGNQNSIEQHNFVQFKANEISCEFEDKEEKLQFQNTLFIFDEKTMLKSGLFNLLNSMNKKLIFCNEEINLSRDKKNAIVINFPNLVADCTWSEFNEIVNYFKYFSNYKNTTSESNKFVNEVCFEIQKSSIKIDDIFFIQSNEFSKIRFLVSENPNLVFEFPEFVVDDLIKINGLSIKVDGFVYDVSIASMNVNLPRQGKITELTCFNYIKKILNIPNDQGSQIDVNLTIDNLKVEDSLTDLEVLLHNVRFSLNSYHSIGAIKTESIRFENLVLNDIEMLLVFNSSDFKPENIDSIFSMEKQRVEKPTKLNLTNIQATIDSIEFNYSNELITKLYNFYNNNSIIECPVSANINKMVIKSIDFQHDFTFSKLTFEKAENSKELKCDSIEFNNFIQKSDEDHEHLLILRKEGSEFNFEINHADVYFNIDILKFIKNVYNSFNLLINDDDSSLIINLNGLQIHLPFPNDPLFKKHDLSIKFDLLIENKKNDSKSIKMSKLTSFFNNNEKKLHFLPLFKDISFSFKLENSKTEQKNFDYSLLEIETSNIDVYLSAIDVLELQMVLDNFKQLISSLFDEKIRSFMNKRKECPFPFTSLNSAITINPIAISLCENNRDSNQYYPALTMLIQNTNKDKHKIIQLMETMKTFSMSFLISVKNMNYFYGKSEILIPSTPFIVAYSDYNNISFGISFSKGIDFNLTHSSFLALMRFAEKFKKKDQTLILKNETKFNYKPKYIVRNNLNQSIHIEYIRNQNKKDDFNFGPGESIPLSEINDDFSLNFKFKEIDGSFYPKYINFPIYFDKNISVSMIQKNFEKIILFNSPLSIQNKLDFGLYVYTYDSNKKTVLCCKLEKNFKFAITKNQYWFSDKQIDVHDPNIISPALFTMFECPNSIKILKGNRLISFNVNKKYDHKTNTKIYQIIPSLIFKNLLLCPISFRLYNSKSKKLNENPIDLQIHQSIQINCVNHSIKSFQISIRLDTNYYEDMKTIKLDCEEDEIYSSSEKTAIKVHKTLKGEQKLIEIFAPYMIFNRIKGNEIIKLTPSSSSNSSNSNSLKISDVAFCGLNSNDDKSMKFDVSLKKHQKIQKAIDMMKLNSNCSTIYLPKKENDKFFYPLNCSIKLGDFPMNETHVVTFTDYLHVINKLPFDFTLSPIDSNKALSNDIDDEEHQNILNDVIEKFSFKIQHQNDQSKKKAASHLISCISKDATFVFSSENYSNKPIVQLNGINRTSFLLRKNDDDDDENKLFYVELNIYEDESTFYACFQVPNNPAPLNIRNTLNVPVLVYQNIRISKNKTKIEPNSSALFAFDEPFINSKQLYFEIDANKGVVDGDNSNSNEKVDDDSKNNDSKSNGKKVDDDDDDDNDNDDVDAGGDVKKIFLFSIEDHLSPLISEENDFIISTSFINKNSKSIVVRSLKEQQPIQSKINVSLSLNSVHISLSDEQQEFAHLTLNDILATTQQDSENTYFHFYLSSIQLDNQYTFSMQQSSDQNHVCLYGTYKDITRTSEREEPSNEKSKSFMNCFAIFPRGVPFFSVINFIDVKIQPIYIVPETSIIIGLNSFFNKIFRSKLHSKSLIIEPSFNSVNVNKTLISYFQISPIKIYISTPRNNRFLNLMLFNWFSSNSDLIISIPKLFTYKFNSNLYYLSRLLKDFYGNEIMDRIFKNKFTKMMMKLIASTFINFNKFNFVPLSSLQSENGQVNSCDNQVLIYNRFNEIELKKIEKQIEKLFIQKVDVISQLIERNSNMISISDQVDNNKFVIGIKKNRNVSQNDADVNLIEIFKLNGIQKVRNPILSLIYSSVDDDEIIDKIQSELFKRHEDTDIKFIIESNDTFYCVSNENIFFVTVNDQGAQVSQFISISNLNSIDLNESLVSLKTKDSIGIEIDLQFTNEEFAEIFVLFLKSQTNIHDIFGSFYAYT